MKCRLQIYSFNNKIFKYTLNQIVSLLNKKKILFNLVILPIKIKKFCILSSPHIDKNAREQFEIHTYKSLLDINFININDFNFFLNIKLSSGIMCNFTELNN